MMIKQKIALIALLLTQLSPMAVMAQEASSKIGFSINPAIVEIPGERGTKTKHTLTVMTTGSEPIPVKISSKTLIPIDNEIDQSRRKEFDASSWVEIPNDSYILEPNKPTKIDFSVKVPKIANPGGHYATIAITALDVYAATDVSQTKIIPEIGASLFITVPGAVVERAELDTTALIAERVTKNSETELGFTLKNLGNVHIIASPLITIYKGEELIEAFALQPQVVLPNTAKLFETTWDGDADIGTYQARVEMVYGTANIPLASVQSDFRVIPPILQLTLFTLGALLGVVLIIRIKHLPRIIKALQGRAHAAPKRFKTFSGKASLDRPVGELAPPDEVVAALKIEKPILGLPEYGRIEIAPEEIEELAVDTDLSNSAPTKTAEVSKTIVDNGASITHIVQTKSSTIVREVAPSRPVQPEAPHAPNKPKHILVIDHQETENVEVLPAKKQSKPKKKSTKTKKKQI